MDEARLCIDALSRCLDVIAAARLRGALRASRTWLLVSSPDAGLSDLLRTAWANSSGNPELRVDVHDERSGMLLERWSVVHHAERRHSEELQCDGNRVIVKSYKAIAVMLRTLYSSLLLLPATRLTSPPAVTFYARQQGGWERLSGSGNHYPADFVPGDRPSRFTLPRVATPYGMIQLGVDYSKLSKELDPASGGSSSPVSPTASFEVVEHEFPKRPPSGLGVLLQSDGTAATPPPPPSLPPPQHHRGAAEEEEEESRAPLPDERSSQPMRIPGSSRRRSQSAAQYSKSEGLGDRPSPWLDYQDRLSQSPAGFAPQFPAPGSLAHSYSSSTPPFSTPPFVGSAPDATATLASQIRCSPPSFPVGAEQPMDLLSSSPLASMGSSGMQRSRQYSRDSALQLHSLPESPFLHRDRNSSDGVLGAAESLPSDDGLDFLASMHGLGLHSSTLPGDAGGGDDDDDGDLPFADHADDQTLLGIFADDFDAGTNPSLEVSSFVTLIEHAPSSLFTSRAGGGEGAAPPLSIEDELREAMEFGRSLQFL